MKIEIRVARAFKYIGSSTTATSTILPSAGAITNCSPRRRGRGVAGPLPLGLPAREVVAQRLLVEARLAPPWLVAIRRPEARRVGREDLVDHEQPLVGRRRGAELELCVRDDDAARPGVAPARLVQREACLLEPLGERATQRVDDLRKGHVLVVPLLGFRGRGEDGRIEPRIFSPATKDEQGDDENVHSADRKSTRLNSSHRTS